MAYERVKDFVFENKWSLLLFFISLVFFIIQHNLDLVWDFASYFMNAEHLFGGGEIYEVYRAPMISFIIGIFLWLGNFAEYVYIVIAAVLFFVGNFKLSGVLHDKYFYKFDLEKWFTRFLFYFLSLNVFVLYSGLRGGTELLGLAFFELFLAFLISGKISGYFLGLAVLSRYNFLYFLPLLFFNKSLKTIIYNLGTFVLVILPWYVYSLLEWGNGLTSIVDSYNLNIFSRRGIEEAVNISSFLDVFNWLLPLFLIGFFVIFYYSCKEKDKTSLKYGSLFLLIGLIVVFDFFNTPFKITRYLFNLTLPIVFFSITGLLFIFSKIPKNLNKEKAKRVLAYVSIAILIVSSVGLTLYFLENINDPLYKSVAEEIKNSNLNGCSFFSSRWVPINYYNPSTKPLKSSLEKAIQRGHPVILFKERDGSYEGYKAEELEKYRVVVKNPSYVILSSQELNSDNCVQWRGYSSPAIGNTCEFVSERAEEKFGLKNFSYDVCSFVNPSLP
ncbi:MAG: hypothetical protein ABEI74_03885 [Candidatus Pacearchaeota archaeon]